MKEEIWNPLFEHEEEYAISNKGRVKSINRIVTYTDGRKYSYPERVLKTCKDSDGYLLFGLHNHGNHRTLKVHRMVLLSFIGNENNLPEVNHKNGRKDDNELENLEWVTSSDNKKHAFKIGLTNPSLNVKPKKGIEHPSCKTLIVYKDGIEIKRYTPIAEATKDGYRLGTMFRQMQRGSTYKGLTFKRVEREAS
jgi:hypothetical protein